MAAYGFDMVNAAVTLPVERKFFSAKRPSSAGIQIYAYAKAPICAFSELFSKKIVAGPKSFFRRAVFPFRGRKQP